VAPDWLNSNDLRSFDCIAVAVAVFSFAGRGETLVWAPPRSRDRGTGVWGLPPGQAGERGFYGALLRLRGLGKGLADNDFSQQYSRAFFV
jgi:hypothetical protein